jgi:hypothetical protein
MHSKPGRRNKHFEIESDTLKILRMVANSDTSITDVLCQQNFLNILILSLDSPALQARTATLDFLLAIVTLNYPTGHQLVIQALEYFKSTRGKKRVFDCLVEYLGNAVTSRGIFGSTVGSTPMDFHMFGFGLGDKAKPPTERDVRDYLVSAVAFIRFIIEIPSEFEYRMYLRHELVSSGIVPVFQKLTTWASSEFHDILQHVVAFENLKTADFKYLLVNMDSELDVDIDDPNQLLSLLKSKLDADDNLTVTTLIQNIVVGTALLDNDTRSYMLSMIEKAVMYIVLDQNGITNFTDAFKLSVEQIIDGLQEIEALENEIARLQVVNDIQERQIQSMVPQNTTKEETVTGISPASLLLHKQHLERIYDTLCQLSPKQLEQLQVPTSTSLERLDSETTVMGKSQQEIEIPSVPSHSGGPPPPPPPPILSAGGTLMAPPPPPPPMGKGIPPPPPMGILGAPPPPGFAPLLPTPIMKYKPKTKIKRVHWDYVPVDTFKESVWHQMKDQSEEIQEMIQKAGLFREIETLFPVMETKVVTRETSEPKETEIQVLSEKRAQNIMIFLGGIRTMSLEELIDSIRTFQDSKLTESMLNECFKSLPEPDEAKMLEEFSPTDNLRKAERFMIMVHFC